MYLVGFPQMQQSCSLSEIITSAFISILSSLNNSLQETNNSLNGIYITKKTYTVNCSPDNGASPYTYFGSVDVSNDINNYGKIMLVSAIDSNKCPVPVSLQSDTKIGVVSNGLSTVTVLILYLHGINIK